MALLTAEQLARLRDIIRDASTSVAISTTGMEVADEELQRLVTEGYVDPEDLHNVVLDSYEYGRLMEQLPGAVEMGYQQFINYLAKNPVELSDQERRAFEFMQGRAGQFCVGLGTRYEGELTLAAADMDQDLAESFRYTLQSEAGQATSRRETIGRLTTRLRQMSEDWARDWGRIASTESHMAHQMGFIENVAERYGSGEHIAKMPEPSACPDCQRLYLDSDGRPRVEPVEWWQRQGVANYGLKRADWRAVMGAMHPWCLLPGQRVLTWDGYKPVEDIVVGDLALQADGTWGHVTQLFRHHYAGPIVELKLSNGETLRVTAGHSVMGDCGHWQVSDLVQDGSQLRSVGISDANDSPPVITKEPIFARVFLGFDRAGVPMAAVYFDGQFARPVTEIDKIAADELIVLKSGDPRLLQERLDHDLQTRERFALATNQSSCNPFVRIDLPTARFMCRGDVQLALLGAKRFHADLLSFGHRSLDDPSLMDALDDGSTRHAELAGYRLYGEILLEVHGDDIGRDHLATAPPGDVIILQPFVDGGSGDAKVLSDSVNRHFLADVQSSQDLLRNVTFQHVSVLSSSSSGYRGDCFNLTVESTNTYISAGVVNKNCQCQVVRVPAGWGFDEDWDMLPLSEIEPTEKSDRPKLTIQSFQKSRKLHYKTNFRGLPISIENRRGSKRYWHDKATGTEGETRFHFPYGYIRLTEGTDGDHVDCFLGAHEDATHAYVVHQMRAPSFKTFDEDKVMLGFLTDKAAKRAYLQHFDQPGFFGSMDAIPIERFVERVQAGSLARGEKIAKAEHFRGSAGLIGSSREVGTMGNAGKPARTPGANTYAAQPTTEHPYGPDARKKRKKKKRKKRDRTAEKERVSISPVRYTDGYVHPHPKADGVPVPDPKPGRKWLDDEQEKRARGRDTAGALTIRPQDTRP